MYHRAYKSVREDQIGFQKYKIHGDIKKRKGDEPEREVWEKEERRERERIEGKEEGKESGGETRERLSTNEKRALIDGRDSAR